MIEGADIDAVLERLATLILRAALSPHAIALHRLIVTESARFPRLAEALAREGATEEAIELIAGLLGREATPGRIAIDDPVFAAQQFLQGDHRAAGRGWVSARR